MPRKIVLVASNTAWSIAKFRGELVRRLRRDGYRVVTVGSDSSGFSSHGLLSRHHLNVNMELNRVSFFNSIFVLFKYLTIILRLKPFFVLSFTIKPNLFLGLLRRFVKFEWIPTISGLGNAFDRGSWFKFALILAFRASLYGSGRVFVQNAHVGRYLVRSKVLKARDVRRVLGSGVPARLRRVSSRRDVVWHFLMIARLIRPKGVVEYIEAAELVRARWPGARFALAGIFDEGHPLEVSKSLILDASARGVVEFLGHVSRADEVMARSRFVVLPSYYNEGVPRVLLEAAGLGVPVIACRKPGSSELMVDGVTGFHCAAKNSVALSEVMIRALSISDSDAHNMGGRFHARVSDLYAEDRVVDCYIREVELHFH